MGIANNTISAKKTDNFTNLSLFFLKPQSIFIHSIPQTPFPPENPFNPNIKHKNLKQTYCHELSSRPAPKFLSQILLLYLQSI